MWMHLSPPIHRGREPPETARKQSGDFWVMATADFEALACLHSGELTKSYGKSTMLLMGKSTIFYGHFSIAMLVHQRVVDFRIFWVILLWSFISYYPSHPFEVASSSPASNVYGSPIHEEQSGAGTPGVYGGYLILTGWVFAFWILLRDDRTSIGCTVFEPQWFFFGWVVKNHQGIKVFLVAIPLD